MIPFSKLPVAAFIALGFSGYAELAFVAFFSLMGLENLGEALVRGNAAVAMAPVTWPARARRLQPRPVRKLAPRRNLRLNPLPVEASQGAYLYAEVEPSEESQPSGSAVLKAYAEPLRAAEAAPEADPVVEFQPEPAPKEPPVLAEISAELMAQPPFRAAS